jgi:hypothetical protein
MSDDRLAELHELLKNPIRQKILLKLGAHDRVSFEDLMKELKIDNPQELRSQLEILSDLVTKAEDDEYLLSEQGVSKRLGGQYMLTEKGHNAVDELIFFPEIKSDNYEEKIDQKYHSKRAHQRNKLLYVLVGAGGGYAFSFFGAAFFTILSKVAFHGPTFFLGDGWPFLLTVFVIAPLLGGFVGYWIGEEKKFKRPEPEWNE